MIVLQDASLVSCARGRRESAAPTAWSPEDAALMCACGVPAVCVRVCVCGQEAVGARRQAQKTVNEVRLILSADQERLATDARRPGRRT